MGALASRRQLLAARVRCLPALAHVSDADIRAACIAGVRSASGSNAFAVARRLAREFGAVCTVCGRRWHRDVWPKSLMMQIGSCRGHPAFLCPGGHRWATVSDEDLTVAHLRAGIAALRSAAVRQRAP